MNAQTDQHGGLIDQLEEAIGSKDLARRAEVLRRVTDLFVLKSGSFSEDQIALFDQVMGKLLEHIESNARAQFGSRIARLPDAPRGVVRVLAQDDAIMVAGPVLAHSERVDVQTLVDTAKTKSQDHLLAISGRKVLTEAVTDVLLDRGNRAVVSATAHNSGAKFSEFGFSTLVRKARGDGDLALCVWSRPDIPRQNLIKLFVDASETIKNQLVEADPRRAELIKSMVAQATDEIQTKARAGSGEFAQAAREVRELNAAGKLNEERLIAFADEGSFDRVVAALSLMCDIPLGAIERAFVQNQTEQIVVLARALDFSWATTMKLLMLHAGVNGSSRAQLDITFANFFRLQPETARTALKFYRMREKANRPK
ncbi:MAG TPA: DUF2336 domain-containing protein [Bradyrhizobium sp.]|uniref:DUF2336 domain-containing protein n=1 Tax=Bradyrhizobium sp. TaxID=376 RepID=UPI002D805C78|nr:DUF2336 domain-containing protein [Bradyrhizobium sp.]HET7887984.1 DUF2336 domain-containing protein [Bradyrhizobium sp.]